MNLDGNSLIAGFAVSMVGAGFFMYGKKQGRAPQIAFGIITAIYPYFVSNWVLMLSVFALLAGLMWLAIRRGL
ncbi:MAG: hypothetical protein ABI335_01785 [Polyangiaceae bacterium]